MAIDWTVVGHPELFKDHARKNHPLHMLLRPPSHLQSLGPTQLFNKVSRSLVQMHEPRISSNPIQVPRNCPYILVDRPLVIIENRDQPFGVVGRIVQSFKSNPACEGRIPRQTYHMLFASTHIAR